MAFEKRVKFKVTADTSQAEGNLKKVNSSITGIGGSLKSMAGYFGVAFGASALSGFLKDSINKYAEQERVVAKLDQTLGHNTKSLQQYASELQSVTRFGDETIINGMALLGMFIKDEEQIKKLTKATLDLASAKQMDLTSAFDLVSKTVGSSTNALGRYGIQVEGVAGSNQRAKNTFEAINKIMGGSSEAEANTTYGRIQSLSNQFGDFQEEIGKGLIPTLTELISTFKTLIGVVSNKGLSDFLDKWLKLALIVPRMTGKGLGWLGGLLGGGGDNNDQEANGWTFSYGTFGTNDVKNDITDIVSETKEWQKVLTRASFEFKTIAKEALKVNLAMQGVGTGEVFIEGRSGAGAGINGRDTRMKKFLKENSFLVQQMSEDINIIGDEFKGMFRSVFGEANSLLEKFLENFLNGLLELGAQSALTGLLNLFIPGAGSVAGMALKPTVINVNLGDETLARAVVKGNNTAQRLRLQD